MEMFKHIMFILAGLGVFLFSIRLMSNSIKSMTGIKLYNIMKFLKKNVLLSCLVGFIFTTMIQSSDGAVALVIGLVAARFLDLKTAIAFILGANIGTASTALIVAAGSSNVYWLKYITYGLLLFSFFGSFGVILFKEEKKINIFTLFFAIGSIFVGLKLIGIGSEILNDSVNAKKIISKISSNSFLSLFFSVALTGLLQSSSAVITAVQTLYQHGAISIDSSLAMVVGANIGTTFTALIASVGLKNKDAKRISIVWLLTNLSMAILIMPIITSGVFSKLILLINNQVNSPLNLAIGHIIFNVSLVMIFLPLTKQMATFSAWIYKDKKKAISHEVDLLSQLIHQSPKLAYQAVKKAVVSMGKTTRETQLILHKYIKEGNKADFKDYKNKCNIIKDIYLNISSFINELNSKNVSKSVSNKLMSLMLSTKSFYYSSKNGYEFSVEISKYYNNKINDFEISLAEKKEFQKLLSIIISINKRSYKLINRYSTKVFQESQEFQKTFNFLIHNYHNNYMSRSEAGLNKKQIDWFHLIRLLENMCQNLKHIGKRSSNKRQFQQEIIIPDKLQKEITSLL